jgi:hypothetical protein
MNRSIIIIGAALLLGCSAAPKPNDPIQRRVVTEGPVRMQTTQSALDAFIPLREGIVEGGDCVMNETTDNGILRMAATFPSRKAPDTSITVWLFSDGRTARYSETRGLPPSGIKIDELQEEMRRTSRTSVQLDYITGEGVLINSPANEAPSGFHGRASAIEKSGKVGDVQKRVDIVRRLCEKSGT